jgi:hypothetical protein
LPFLASRRGGAQGDSHVRPPRFRGKAPPAGLDENLVTRRLEVALEEIRGEGWRDEITNLDPAKTQGGQLNISIPCR